MIENPVVVALGISIILNVFMLIGIVAVVAAVKDTRGGK